MDKSRKTGFTLLELMTVMVIMFILLGASSLALRGMVRGSGLSGAVSTTRAVLTQARQNAIMTGRRTAVIVTRERMVMVAQYGRVDFLPPGPVVTLQLEQDLPWSEIMMQGNRFYNMRLGTFSLISHDDAQDDYRQFRVVSPNLPGASLSWQVGDGVGLQTGPERALPDGFVFGNIAAGTRRVITFLNTGASLSGETLSIQEELLPNAPAMVFTVDQNTGRITIPE